MLRKNIKMILQEATLATGEKLIKPNKELSKK